MSSDTINIRQIQHYMYCPRRFALLEINDDWAENAFVVKANIMHENVHSGNHKFSSASIVSRSSVAIYNDEDKYNIFGIVDCIEFVMKGEGVPIDGLSGEYAVKVIEYKPKQPRDNKFNETDAIQVFAQKICADYIWHCDCKGYLYYSDTKKRVELPFDEQFDYYNSQLLEYLSQMRRILCNGEIPDRRKSQKCGGCSLEDYCFSKKSLYSVKEHIFSADAMEEI